MNARTVADALVLLTGGIEAIQAVVDAARANPTVVDPDEARAKLRDLVDELEANDAAADTAVDEKFPE